MGKSFNSIVLVTIGFMLPSCGRQETKIQSSGATPAGQSDDATGAGGKPQDNGAEGVDVETERGSGQAGNGAGGGGNAPAGAGGGGGGQKGQMPLLTPLSLTSSSRSKPATIFVGPTRQYKSPCALINSKNIKPGDVIEVDAGTYANEACHVTVSGTAAAPIVLRGAEGQRPVLDGGTRNLNGAGSNPRAILQFTGAKHWLVEFLEFSNAKGDSNNGAAFRVTAGGAEITFLNVLIQKCQNGAMSDGAATVRIEASEIRENGINNGYSHNLYLQGQSTVLVGNHIHSSKGGQNVKLRSHYAELWYNYIIDAGNYDLDFVESAETTKAHSNILMVGNVVVRKAKADNNGKIINFGSGSPSIPRSGSLYAFHNTFVMRNGQNCVLHMWNPAEGSYAHFYNNVIHATVGGTDIGCNPASAQRVQGENNWVTQGITIPAGLKNSVSGVDPGIVAADGFRPVSSAAIKDQAIPLPSYFDGQGTQRAADLKFQFASPLGLLAREAAGVLDLGAFEVKP